MNRRSFFTNLLGAACLAAAERIMPSALVKAASPTAEPVMTFQGIPIRFIDALDAMPNPRGLSLIELMQEAMERIPVSGRKVIYKVKR